MKAVEAQTNKQEDKKDVPGETTHTHTHMRALVKTMVRSFALLKSSFFPYRFSACAATRTCQMFGA